MKPQNFKTRCYRNALLALFIFVNVSAQAQNAPETTVISQQYFSGLKFIIITLLIILAMLIFFAGFISENKFELFGLPNPKKPVTGRNPIAGQREVVRIFSFGVIALGIAFTLGMKPAPAPLASAALVVDSEPVLTEVSSLLATADLVVGQQKFELLCVACHGPKAGGTAAAPNLTDAYWINGGSDADLFKTITEGVPAKGMMPWKGPLKPKERLSVVKYIQSLQGSSPADAREPQGDLYPPAK